MWVRRDRRDPNPDYDRLARRWWGAWLHRDDRSSRLQRALYDAMEELPSAVALVAAAVRNAPPGAELADVGTELVEDANHAWGHDGQQLLDALPVSDAVRAEIRSGVTPSQFTDHIRRH